jgi:hypothetical protein
LKGPDGVAKGSKRRMSISFQRELRADFPDGMPPQIPAWSVAEMWHEGFEARLHDRCANRILYMIPVVHRGVYTVDFYLFGRSPSEARPELVGDIGQDR